MLKPRNLKAIKSGLDDDNQIAFYPRMASKAEREEVDSQLAEAEADSVGKYQRIFEIKRDAIAHWSASLPQKLEKVKSEVHLVPLVKDVTNTQDAMSRFFAAKTAESEELIDITYAAFLNLMRGSVSFL